MKQVFSKSTMQLSSRRNNLLLLHNNEILAKTNTLSASVSVDAQVPWRYIFPARIFTGARFFNLFRRFSRVTP